MDDFLRITNFFPYQNYFLDQIFPLNHNQTYLFIFFKQLIFNDILIMFYKSYINFVSKYKTFFLHTFNIS